MKLRIFSKLPGFVLFLSLSACAGQAPPARVADANVFVVGVGWHTQIYLRVATLRGGLRGLAVPGARYVGFGFAQRAYAMPRDHAPLAYVKGFFRGLVPGRGIIIVTWLRRGPAFAWGSARVVPLRATPAGMARLNAALWRDFGHRDGRPMRLERGFYPGSAFYAARPRYDLLFTCNSWTDAMLRAAGFGLSGGDAVFASMTMRGVRRLSAAQADHNFAQ